MVLSSCNKQHISVDDVLITITPEKALFDEPVKITITNLAPREKVTVEASCKNKDNDVWKSYAMFRADNKGMVHVVKQAPLCGSYKGIDPMGLFWSLTSIDKDLAKNTSMAQGTINLGRVLLSVFSGDKLRAQKVINRIWPDVEIKEIRQQGVVGTLCYPKNVKKMPGIIIIHGAGGVPDIGLAQVLASHGYTVLALVYFGVEGLPKNLSLIPLEYFKNAMRWLKKQPQVEGNKIALLGQTRGAEVGLLLASLFPGEMNACIIYSPYHFVCSDYSQEQKSAWTYKNKPVPFMPMFISEQEVLEGVKEGQITLQKGTIDDPMLFTQFSLYRMKKISNKIKEESIIPVENICCPILIISGNDDQQWLSPVSGKSIMDRLDCTGSRIKRKYVNYPNAGNHLLAFPYRSSIDLPFIHASWWTVAGGTPEGNAHAIEQAWKEMLKFLKEM